MSLSKNTNESMRKDITIDILRKRLSDPVWDWDKLSLNPSISSLDIVQNKDLPWNWTKVEQRTDIRLILQNPQCPWTYYRFFERPDVTMDVILEFPEFVWNYELMSSNYSISIHDIAKFPKFGWNWDIVSKRGDYKSLN